jgi:hypothetical protein
LVFGKDFKKVRILWMRTFLFFLPFLTYFMLFSFAVFCDSIASKVTHFLAV